MRAWQRTVLGLVCAGVWAFGTPTGAFAQVCGDADGNGSVKPNDVLLLLRAVSELPTAVNLCGASPCGGRSCGDADGDCVLTAADVLLCLRASSQLPNGAGVCPGR